MVKGKGDGPRSQSYSKGDNLLEVRSTSCSAVTTRSVVTDEVMKPCKKCLDYDER